MIAEIIVSILGTLSPLFSVWYSSFADSCVFCEWKCFDFEKGARAGWLGLSGLYDVW